MKTVMYPTFSVSPNTKPNKFYAVPLIGFLVKIVMLIPVVIELVFVGIASCILLLCNSLVVLFTGKYWDPAYSLTLGVNTLQTKMYMFLTGLTDLYPGFALATNNDIKIAMAKPANPNRFFAVPVLGGLARVILLIPYIIFEGVMQHGAGLAMVVSFWNVLTKGKYPESTYEFISDFQRVSLSASFYMAGFSDSYPSFKISMNHQAIKIFLLIAGTLLFLGNIGREESSNSMRNNYNSGDYQYQAPQNVPPYK